MRQFFLQIKCTGVSGIRITQVKYKSIDCVVAFGERTEFQLLSSNIGMQERTSKRQSDMNLMNALVRPPQSRPCCAWNRIWSVLWRQSFGSVPCSSLIVAAINVSRSFRYCTFSADGGPSEPKSGSRIGGCGTWHLTPDSYTCTACAI